MLGIIRQPRATVCGCALFFVTVGQAYGQFTTIRNIPPDPNIGDIQSIGSDTQLNVFDGGVVGQVFGAGEFDGTTANIEVNIFGGSVGDYFRAFDGSVVNITGGSVGSDFIAFDGSVVNVSGGAVGRYFDAFRGSTVNISGGFVDGPFNNQGSTVNITGGAFGDGFRSRSGSVLNISGGEFRLDGVLLGGLDTVGDTLALNLPNTSVLSGTFADGTPFAFSSIDNDAIFSTLTQLPHENATMPCFQG